MLPEYAVQPVAAYCDMSSLQGGWQMCYTDWKDVDLKNSVFDESVTFGREGYRSDCSNTPFDEIIFLDHDFADPQAYSVTHEAAFQYQGRNSIVASLSDWNGTALGINGFPVISFYVLTLTMQSHGRCSLQLVCSIGYSL